MCGLTGFYNLSGRAASKKLLRGMVDAVAHRGPDGEGFYAHGPVALGHRRLAIIDLSAAAAQPMATENGRFTLVYNGMVYNYRELRRELETLGHTFSSESDTEVVLKALAAWGRKGLERFNGMFALALYDSREKSLLLARDRYGIKPLYYAICANTLVFGSEIKSVLQHGAVTAEMDRKGLLEYCTFQNFFTENTLFKNVKILHPGTSMHVGEGGGITHNRYWDYHFTEPEVTPDRTECVEELERLFAQAVKRQLISDVELGSYLSGGVDSGAITSVAASVLPYVKTFTVGFDLKSATGMEMAFDEREKAEHMSYLFKTEHYEMVLKAGDMERALPQVVAHMEEPRVGQCYPNFYAAKLAAKFCKVVLGGTGGDELFGGYPWRYYRALVNDDFEHYVDKYYVYWQRLIPNKEIRTIFSPIWNDVKDVWTRDIFRDVFTGHAQQLTRPEDYINHSLYFEAKTFLHGLLVVEDKLAMAHGLEGRVPFLDNDLVDFAMQLPVAFKMGNLQEVLRINENDPGSKKDKYYERTRDGKIILRQAMERHISREIAEGVKQGFSAPDASWFRGDSIDYVRRVLLGRSARIYDYLDRKSVQGLVQQHLDGKENRRLLIWSLLNLEQWCEQFLS